MLNTLNKVNFFTKEKSMKLVSLLVALCFTMNVFAATNTISALEQAMDEYQYALSVEWDQKDNSFQEAQTKIFFEKIATLIKEEGLTQAQVMTMIEGKIENKEALNALKLKASLLAKAQNTEELIKMVRESSKDFYAQGASWNGGAMIVGYAIVAVILGVVAYSIYWSATHECVRYENQYVCNTYSDCYGGGYGGGYYGGGYYGGGYCYGGYTTCGYADVCVEYAKKD